MSSLNNNTHSILALMKHTLDSCTHVDWFVKKYKTCGLVPDDIMVISERMSDEEWLKLIQATTLTEISINGIRRFIGRNLGTDVIEDVLEQLKRLDITNITTTDLNKVYRITGNIVNNK